MITKEMAIHASEFHANGCTITRGARGGIITRIVRWRANGMAQTWKRSPERFGVPIKYGLYACSSIDNYNADAFHVPSDCPALQLGMVGSDGWPTAEWGVDTGNAGCDRCGMNDRIGDSKLCLACRTEAEVE